MDLQKNPDAKSFELTDFPWMVVMSLLFFVLVALAIWRTMDTDWAPIQKKFRRLLEQHAQVDAARSFRPGIRQIWVPKIDVVDRCVTCHLGYEWSSVLAASTAEPLTPHPDPGFMSQHPFPQYGCTVCHGGQGWATETLSAHAAGGEIWEDPLITPKLASAYGLTMGQMMQMRCNFCHRHDVTTPGMGEIDLAKVLFKKKKCLVCHVVEGRGGHTGPELTYEGDKNPELFDYSRAVGRRTVFNWQFQHLKTPDKIWPGTQMPEYAFSDREARALTLLLLSWKQQKFPPQYIPAAAEAPPSPSPSK
ncbi:MAG TPA: c-type cytochrome [Candidatus Binataceae bacterium]